MQMNHSHPCSIFSQDKIVSELAHPLSLLQMSIAAPIFLLELNDIEGTRDIKDKIGAGLEGSGRVLASM